jgi:hypothetical protein
MPKALCILGVATAALFLLLFGMDLAVGFPFGGASMVMDIIFLLCSGVLGYLSWVTLREQT